MQKLSGIDATFLYMETAETPMHISSLLVCEPSKKDVNPYEALKSQIADRLHEIPSFHRKLKNTPFYIDHPVWVTAETVDLDYHIKHARLPDPGTVDQLNALIQGLHSIRLDRDRPLWQFVIIEGVEDPKFGLPKGSFAIYTKGHHASLDGGAGISAMDILSDREPVPRPPLPKNQIRLYSEDPGFYELLGTAYGKFAQKQADFLGAIPGFSKAIGKFARSIMDDSRGVMKNFRPAPKTRFNVRIQKQRAYGAQSLPIKEVIAVAKATGTTLNDVVLTICGGALRKYLSAHGELPSRSLMAAVPVSLRELGDTSNTNQVAGMNCDIGSDLADPLKRLRAVNSDVKEVKKHLAAIKDIIPTDFSFFGAPVLVSAIAGLMSKTDLINYLPAPFNVLISNVPGPRRHMYFAGSKVLTYFPVSIPAHGAALNITLQSYVDRLDFGLIACKRAVPDVQDIADLIVAEFAALQAAVTAEQAPGSKASKATVSRGKTKSTTSTVKKASPKAPAKSKQKAANKNTKKAS